MITGFLTFLGIIYLGFTFLAHLLIANACADKYGPDRVKDLIRPKEDTPDEVRELRRRYIVIISINFILFAFNLASRGGSF